MDVLFYHKPYFEQLCYKTCDINKKLNDRVEAIS